MTDDEPGRDGATPSNEAIRTDLCNHASLVREWSIRFRGNPGIPQSNGNQEAFLARDR